MKDYRNDVPMMYETFLRRVYHCGRAQDPFKLADTDRCHMDENDQFKNGSYVGMWTALYLL